MYELDKVGMLSKFLKHDDLALRRQDLPELYIPNGAVFVASVAFIKRKKSFLSQGTVGVVMPDNRSIDVDTELDIEICNYFLT